MSWHPASNGAGKRHWFVAGPEGDVHEDVRGRLVWYGSLPAAQAVADRLNERDAERAWERENLIDIDPARYAE